VHTIVVLTSTAFYTSALASEERKAYWTKCDLSRASFIQLDTRCWRR
jgi:hypothetical protein